jgi:RimJ/RimL family protein N-acetyltransferase
MQLTKFGVTLRLLTESDIERVRVWRNQDFVRLNMEYQHEITEQQQRNWFNALDKHSNYYFIISFKEKEVGLVNLKSVNKRSKSAEAGIFIGDKAYLNTYIPIAATIALMDFAYEELNLQSLLAKISKHNKKAILFNEKLGYVFKEPVNSNYDYYQCTENDFKTATNNLRASLQKF